MLLPLASLQEVLEKVTETTFRKKKTVFDSRHDEKVRAEVSRAMVEKAIAGAAEGPGLSTGSGGEPPAP